VHASCSNRRELDWGRIASSPLRAIGREEWIAHNEEEYVSIVSSLARDVERRKALRKSQRSMMAASPQCDANGLARSIEDAV
jgi:protein O-GlcNAc transferase